MLKRVAQGVLDFLIPPHCAHCGEILSGTGFVCAACFLKLSFIVDPQCERCGFPFEGWMEGQSSLCLACQDSNSFLDQTRSALAYDDVSKAMILRFKHGDAVHLAPGFVQWMAQAGKNLLSECDGIIPVPLHWRRLFKRRYNQAALLAQGLGKVVHKSCWVDGLVRHRHTPSQGGLSKQDRHKNVATAFSLNHRYVDRMKGRHVLLIDDVLTTGATLEHCARLLRLGGVKKISALTLARVVKPMGLE
jgi:ComF family protein